jgi:adenylate cyclase class 2
MATELEAKVKVEDLQIVRDRLKKTAATSKGSALETNMFFDAADGRLRKADRGLRIRIARNESGKEHCTVTMKGPLMPGDMKSREEIEYTISDAAAAEQVFTHLGFPRTISFQKRRESWELGGCKIELDELPNLGTFVEVEGESESEIQAVLRKLELQNLPMIKTGYVSMLWKYLEQKQIAEREIRFS